MKFVQPSHFTDPDTAARLLIYETTEPSRAAFRARTECSSQISSRALYAPPVCR
jgi:hypothetical protein